MPQAAYVITGPTSGIGKATALRMAAPDRTIVLVGRNESKLNDVKFAISAACPVEIVQCDFSDVVSCRQAAAQLIDMCREKKLSLQGVLNNAGVSPTVTTKTKQGWDTTFATNYICQVVFTEALIPQVPHGCQFLFVTSKTEDPSQPLPKRAGMRGGRFISVEASIKGEWDTSKRNGGPSNLPGANAYATSKQCLLASVFVLARANPAVRINALEPGWIPGTGLSRGAGAVLVVVSRYLMQPIAARTKGGSTVDRTSSLIQRLLLAEGSLVTGQYYDEKGEPMEASAVARDVKHQELVMKQTRELLSTI